MKSSFNYKIVSQTVSCYQSDTHSPPTCVTDHLIPTRLTPGVLSHVLSILQIVVVPDVVRYVQLTDLREVAGHSILSEVNAF